MSAEGGTAVDFYAVDFLPDLFGGYPADDIHRKYVTPVAGGEIIFPNCWTARKHGIRTSPTG